MLVPCSLAAQQKSIACSNLGGYPQVASGICRPAPKCLMVFSVVWSPCNARVNGSPAASSVTMHISDSPNTVDACQQVKQEIERLTRKQSEALKTATFVGMTPDEAKEYDDRRQQITRLVEQLRSLQNAQ